MHSVTFTKRVALRLMTGGGRVARGEGAKMNMTGRKKLSIHTTVYRHLDGHIVLYHYPSSAVAVNEPI